MKTQKGGLHKIPEDPLQIPYNTMETHMKTRAYLFGSTVKGLEKVYNFPKCVKEFVVYSSEGSYGMLMFYKVKGVEKRVSVKIPEDVVVKIRRAIGR